MSRIIQLAINDEGFVFDPATGESYTTNSTGLLILKGLKQGKSMEEMTDGLIEEFVVEKDEAESGILAFMDFLRASAIL
jgi:PqqD family protein of HPr-rel-A system